MFTKQKFKSSIFACPESRDYGAITTGVLLGIIYYSVKNTKSCVMIHAIIIITIRDGPQL